MREARSLVNPLAPLGARALTTYEELAAPSRQGFPLPECMDQGRFVGHEVVAEFIQTFNRPVTWRSEAFGTRQTGGRGVDWRTNWEGARGRFFTGTGDGGDAFMPPELSVRLAEPGVADEQLFAQLRRTWQANVRARSSWTNYLDPNTGTPVDGWHQYLDGAPGQGGPATPGDILLNPVAIDGNPRPEAQLRIAGFHTPEPDHINDFRLSYISGTQTQLGPGQCADSTNGTHLIRSNANPVLDITVNGLNGLDVGAAAPLTWYAVYVVYDPITRQAGGVYSLNPGAPVLTDPSLQGYTLFRRIGWVRTLAGAGGIEDFEQYGSGKDRRYERTTTVVLVAAGIVPAVFPAVTAVSFAAQVAPTAQQMQVGTLVVGSAVGDLVLFRPTGTPGLPGYLRATNAVGSGLGASELFDMSTDANQSIDVTQIGTGLTTVSLWAVSWEESL